MAVDAIHVGRAEHRKIKLTGERPPGGGSLINRSPVPSLDPLFSTYQQTASDILYALLLLVAPVSYFLPKSNVLGQDASRAPLNSNIGVWLLLGVKRTSVAPSPMPAFDPKRTFGSLSAVVVRAAGDSSFLSCRLKCFEYRTPLLLLCVDKRINFGR